MVTFAMMMSMIDKWWDYFQRDHADKVWRHCGASLRKESNLLHFLLQVRTTHLSKITTQTMTGKLQDVLGDRADWCSTWSHSPSRPPLLYWAKVPFVLLSCDRNNLSYFQDQRCKVDWESKSAASEKSPRLIKLVKKRPKVIKMVTKMRMTFSKLCTRLCYCQHSTGTLLSGSLFDHM